MEADQSIAEASAVILAGGKSSRMGRPKALLPFDREPLILHAARALKRLFAEVVVVAAPGEQFVELSSLFRSEPNKPEVTLVHDEVPHQGPVGGIYYGLKAAGGRFAFVTSCDLPFLNLQLISHLAAQIEDYDVVVPHWQGRLQPLHAVYRRSVLPLLEEQLGRGELRLALLYEKVRTREIAEGEIHRFDSQGMSFLNMNSPEDYRRATRLWLERHHNEVSDAHR